MPSTVIGMWHCLGMMTPWPLRVVAIRSRGALHSHQVRGDIVVTCLVISEEHILKLGETHIVVPTLSGDVVQDGTPAISFWR